MKKRIETSLTIRNNPNDHFWALERDVTDSNSLKTSQAVTPRGSCAAIDKRDISFRVWGERLVALSISLASQGTHSSLPFLISTKKAKIVYQRNFNELFRSNTPKKFRSFYLFLFGFYCKSGLFQRLLDPLEGKQYAIAN